MIETGRDGRERFSTYEDFLTYALHAWTTIPCLPAFQSIDIAHQNMKRGRLFINRGTVENSQMNRSPFSYLENPASERSR